MTASRDFSLRVLTWRNDVVTLESRYHLLGGSHMMSRYFRFHILLGLICMYIYIYIYLLLHLNPNVFLF